MAVGGGIEAMMRRFLSRQLARPTGWFGRFFMARWLDKANIQMNHLTIDSLALKADDRLLEVGFGGGYLLGKVLEEGSCAFAAGVELSGEMVRCGRQRFRSFIESGKVEIAHGDIEHIPFADAEFTKLCSVNTLYFWRDPASALAECRRVLKPGGRIALCFNAKADLAAWLEDTTGFELYELSEVETMLSGSGFGHISVASGQDPKQGLFYCVTAVAA
jgi:ubiquinone/menaquinone biosynthesis C-methylase UbiE